MANATDPGNRSSLSPDEAFAVLGNETRVSILQTLGGEDDPLTFTELRNRVGIRQGSQFNYHLDKLVGHFVRKTDEGYTLRQAGTRVVEAVLSGAVTETVVIEPTRLDAPCPYCGADIEISYREERLLVRCTDCVGSFGSKESTSKSIGTVPPQTLTLSYLPSAGVSGRSPQDILDFSPGLSRVETITMANGNCPRCAGSVDQSIEVCDDHRPNGAICGNCNTRFAVIYDYRCTNCNHRKRGGFSHHLLKDPRVRSFFGQQGIDPIWTKWNDLSPIYDYDEDINSVDPFVAQFTFSVAGDNLIVSVNDDLIITDISLIEDDSTSD